MEEFSEQQQALIDQIAEKSAMKALQHLGFDIENPRETQKDIHYMTKSRKTAERIEDLKLGMWFRVFGGLILAAVVAYVGLKK